MDASTRFPECANRSMQFAKLWDRCDLLVRGKPSNGRQIAGMSAWRVICRLGLDESGHCSQRMRAICFGSCSQVCPLHGAELVAVASQQMKAGAQIVRHMGNMQQDGRGLLIGDTGRVKVLVCMEEGNNTLSERKQRNMRIAIPLTNGLLAQHFGHCAHFAFIDVDTTTKKILGSAQEAAPEHEPGLLPRWLRDRGVTVVIAGGMGPRAQTLFAQAGVEVLTGAESREPETIARDYLNGALVTGANSCDH